MEWRGRREEEDALTGKLCEGKTGLRACAHEICRHIHTYMPIYINTQQKWILVDPRTGSVHRVKHRD